MPGDEAFLKKYIAEGGDLKTLKDTGKSSQEYIDGKKVINFSLKLEGGGEFSATQDAEGLINIRVTGNKGAIDLLEHIKSSITGEELNNLLIIAPPYALNKFPEYDPSNQSPAEVDRAYRYSSVKGYAKHGLSAYVPTPPSFKTPDSVEKFLVMGEAIDPKIWILILLHEVGHAFDSIDHDYSMPMPDSEYAKEISRRERSAWSNGLNLARTVKEKTGADLLKIFGSLQELQRWMHSAMLGHRVSFTEETGTEIGDELFDKGKLKRLK